MMTSGRVTDGESPALALPAGGLGVWRRDRGDSPQGDDDLCVEPELDDAGNMLASVAICWKTDSGWVDGSDGRSGFALSNARFDVCHVPVRRKRAALVQGQEVMMARHRL